MTLTYCMGIESTAHTFGIGIIDSKTGKVLANVRDMLSTTEGGLVPSDLSEHHVDCAPSVLRKALSQAGITLRDISLIAYSRSPGIGHALRIGAGLARSLSLRYDIPVVGVNHCIAHLEVGKFLGGEIFSDPVLLYVSGANTQVIALEGGAYRIFGETLDLGVGNFLDTLARDMGEGFPGGPRIEELAAEYAASYDSSFPPLHALPYAVKGMDVSFSGIQTSARRALAKNKDNNKGALAYAVQEHVFAMLCEVAERALAHTQKSSLVLGGGVACNARLQEMCKIMCDARGVQLFIPPREFLVDNGAMIALLGIVYAKAKKFRRPCDIDIDPYERTDDVNL